MGSVAPAQLSYYRLQVLLNYDDVSKSFLVFQILICIED